MGFRGARVASAVALVAALCGCTAQGASAPTASPTPRTPVDWSARLAAFISIYGSNPAPDRLFTDPEATEVTAATANVRWLQILMQYPHAVRPSDSFIHWATNGDSDVAACLMAAGAIPNPGSAADGTPSLGYSSPSTEEYAVASFDCEFVRYPVRQSPWPNRAQLSYYYDYLTHFLVPCYRAHGAEIDPGMPGRSEFIAQNQSDYFGTRWQLTPPDAADAPDPTYDGAGAVCSAIGPGGAEQ